MIWKVLGIDKTKDEDEIKNAYRNKLRYVNPEDDEEGFKELRRAYEEALEYASAEDTVDEEVEEFGFDGRKNEVDAWIDRVDAVYQDVALRRDVKKWETLLSDSVCDDLDTEIEAAEKLLVYIMQHAYMPQNIWQLLDRRFGYRENIEQLKERFPENYLEYIVRQIENPGFIDYDLFDGKTDDHVDDYISKLYEIKNMYESPESSKIRQLLTELGRFELEHPFYQVEEARFLLLQYEESKKDDIDKANEFAKKALEIMEELDFEYSDNLYVERIYAECLLVCEETSKARKVYENMLEKKMEDADPYTASLGLAKCTYLEGHPEEAKEQVEDVLEERVQDVESLELLDQINETLVATYLKKLEEEQDVETCYKLGWCYYQQKEFSKGIELLDSLDAVDTYEYINLRCRLYLANEEYEKAYPLARNWLDMIESTVDDGSREMKKRKNRLSLAHFSVGVCIWEEDYKKAESDEKREEAYAAASKYIQTAVEEEHNRLVRLSYMEQLARFYLDAKEYEKCIQVADEIIAQDRGFFPAYVHRQKAHYELKNAKEVIDDYFACQELYPPYAPPYILAAEVFYAFEQYDDVERVLENAESAGIESDALELYRIKCLHYKEFSKEHTVEALKALEQLKDKIQYRQSGEETDIENPYDIAREHAVLYWDLEDANRTVEVINKYLEEDANCTNMLQLKVDVFNRLERDAEALEVCKQLYLLDQSINIKTLLGLCFERNKRFDEAKKYYMSAYEMDKTYTPALRRLMYLLSFLSNRERDLELCKEAVFYATEYIELTGAAEGYVERGNLYIDLYELDKAVADCEKAIELDESAYYAYNNLGCALLKLRKIDKAIVPLEQVIKMAPEKEALPYLNLAECYALQERYEETIKLYEKVIELWPRRAGLLEDIAKLHRKLGRFDEAIEVYKKIPEVFRKTYADNEKNNAYYSNVVESLCNIGATYAQAENHKDAEKYFKKAMRKLMAYKGNSMPDKIEEIVEYYRDLGELEQAEKMIKQLFKFAQKRSIDDKHLSFTYATVLFELGRTEEASTHAKRFLKDLFDRKGEEEQLLADERYRSMYLYDLGIMYLCAGKTEKAKEYFEQIRNCKLCVTCEALDCFEYYFGMGLIAELNGEIEKAKELYEKAIVLRGDYPCAKHHLNKLRK